MKGLKVKVLFWQFVTITFIDGICASTSFRTCSSSGVAHDRFLIKVNDSCCIEFVRGKKEYKSLGFRLIFDLYKTSRGLHSGQIWVVEFDDGVFDIDTLVSEMRKIRCIEYVEYDFVGCGGGGRVVPDDPLFLQQWYLDSEMDTDIDAPEGWFIETGDELIVAVLDSGIDLRNPSLLEIYVGGYDFVNDDEEPQDDFGHGTAVASLIASRGNDGMGIAGVSWRAEVLAIKVLDETNSGFYSWWIEGLGWAVSNGASIINMSLGGRERSSALEDAVNSAVSSGAVIVSAVMNDGQRIVYYPAGYEAVIAVGATDEQGARASQLEPGSWGSNYGDHIDLVAPGSQVLASDIVGDGYSYWNGTSVSAALVSGAVALLLSVRSGLAPADVEVFLKVSARDRQGDLLEDTEGWDIYYGAGRLDLDDLLQTQGIDLDGDGWEQPEDCDDSNPDVNPGQEEIPFNDIDDDCNPLTSDNCCFDFDEDGVDGVVVEEIDGAQMPQNHYDDGCGCELIY